jgi:hypothetical protein
MDHRKNRQAANIMLQGCNSENPSKFICENYDVYPSSWQISRMRIHKIIRGFLWKGGKDVKGGHCIVGWQRVCHPTDLGGLGILNLDVPGWALQMRWLWLQKTQPERSWTNLDIQVHPNVSALFKISVISMVGDGKSTCFWADHWLHGQTIQDLAPALFALVPKQIAKIRTVHEALQDLR